MGEIFSGNGLTQPNTALMGPNQQPTFVGTPAQVLSRANANLPSADEMLGPDVLNPNASPTNIPTIGRPTFLQAAQAGAMPGGANAMSPGLSKLGKLGVLLMGGAQGALAGRAADEQMIAASGGRRSGGAGTGFMGAIQYPVQRAMMQQQVQRGGLENQLLQNQVQMAPQFNLLKFLQGQSEITKNIGEGNKANAEAGAVPTKQALDEAQALAARYKEDPGSGSLIDLQTGQPVNGQGFVPLSAAEASILGKQPGERVPLKLANTANEMVNRGIRTVNAGGRSSLVDSKGNTIKDLGAASNVVSFNLQNQGLTGGNGQPSALAQAVANGQMQWKDVISPRTPQSVKESFAKEVKSINPNFNSGDFTVEQKVREAFTSGGYSQNLNAIDTARKHMATFRDLAGDLNSGSVRAFNSLGNALGIQFGSDAATNFNIAKQFFSGEVGKAVVTGGGTAGERDQLAESISTASSWKQLTGALKTADALLSGKQEALKNTYQSGQSGQPNFGGNTGGVQPQATHVFIPGQGLQAVK